MALRYGVMVSRGGRGSQTCEIGWLFPSTLRKHSDRPTFAIPRPRLIHASSARRRYQARGQFDNAVDRGRVHVDRCSSMSPYRLLVEKDRVSEWPSLICTASGILRSLVSRPAEIAYAADEDRARLARVGWSGSFEIAVALAFAKTAAMTCQPPPNQGPALLPSRRAARTIPAIGRR
jgi:hypothetical protein